MSARLCKGPVLLPDAYTDTLTALTNTLAALAQSPKRKTTSDPDKVSDHAVVV